jgi:hypothetical protein
MPVFRQNDNGKYQGLSGAFKALAGAFKAYQEISFGQIAYLALWRIPAVGWLGFAHCWCRNAVESEYGVAKTTRKEWMKLVGVVGKMVQKTC